MSMLFGDDKNSSIPKREEPQLQNTNQMQPWFVAEAKEKKNINQKAKDVTKQTASILFPIIGLTVIILTLVAVILFTVGLYE